MKGTYPVTMDGEVVGTVSVSRNGLYYDLFCRCRVDGDQMLDLMIETNQGSRQLGLLAPAGDRLVLQKRIPVKQIGDGICGFILQFRNVKANEFIPVIPDRPFSKLYLLAECEFAVHNGQIGVEIRKKNYGEKVENKS